MICLSALSTPQLVLASLLFVLAAASMPLLPLPLLRVAILLPLPLADDLDTASMCAETKVMLPLIVDAIELFGAAASLSTWSTVCSYPRDPASISRKHIPS